MSEWDVVLRRFGCRGPLEMDVESPRYADGPALALRQMRRFTSMAPATSVTTEKGGSEEGFRHGFSD
jgi:hypothetical protein